MTTKWVLFTSFHKGQQVILSKPLFVQKFPYIAGLPLKKREYKTFQKGTECEVVSVQLWQFAVRLYALKVISTGEILDSIPEESLEVK